MDHKWLNCGGIWITEKGGLSISLDADKLPKPIDGKIRVIAFKNENKERKQPDYRVMIKGEESEVPS